MAVLINRGHVMIAYLENLGRKDSYKAKYEALAKAVDEAPAVATFLYEPYFFLLVLYSAR